jgi:hypothetical protein
MLFKVCIDVVLAGCSRKYKLMLLIGKDFYIHKLFTDDQVVIMQGVEDANYMDRKIEEEYEKWGLNLTMEIWSI